MGAVEADGVATRHPDLILARLHLRLGSLALARAELETLAGQDALDEDGLVDLAEARWRTGDIAGAGEAAAAALNEEEGPLLALIVAAEAAAARGRPTEARRLAEKAMEAAAGTIDAIFSGMPRAGVWPPDAAAPPPSPTTMFDPPQRGASPVHRHPRPLHERPAEPAPAEVLAMSESLGASGAASGDEADAATVGLWEIEGPSADTDLVPEPISASETEPAPDATTDLPAADVELDLGRAALEADDPDEAAVRLGLVLRVAPALAPAVLDLVEGRLERGLVLVRGDAYRLVGRELEARRAFAEASRGASWPPPGPEDDADLPILSGDSPVASTDYPTDDPSEGDPA